METTTKTPSVHSRFFYAINRLHGVKKDDIVLKCSNYTTTSLSEFLEKNPTNYWLMVSNLETLSQQNSYLTEKAIKAKRSAILKRLQQHGVDTTDWRKVNAFLEQPRIAGKRLYEMSIEEMQAFIRKMESILKKDKEQQEKMKQLTLFN